jgi:hypothetical protein
MISYGENQTYTITYKEGFKSKERSILIDAPTKLDAEELFRRNFGNWCEIIKTQTNEEVAKEIADSIFKNIRKDLGKLVGEDKKPIIDSNKVKNIDYNSKSFKRGLKKVNKQCEGDTKMSTPDYEKKYISYNI